MAAAAKVTIATEDRSEDISLKGLEEITRKNCISLSFTSYPFLGLARLNFGVSQSCKKGWVAVIIKSDHGVGGKRWMPLDSQMVFESGFEYPE